MDVQWKMYTLIRMEEQLNRLKVEKEDYSRMDKIMSLHLEQWDEITEELYFIYPELEKYDVDINEIIAVFTSVVPKVNVTKEKENEFIDDYAWELTDLIIDFCQNINDLLKKYAAVH